MRRCSCDDDYRKRFLHRQFSPRAIFLNPDRDTAVSVCSCDLHQHCQDVCILRLSDSAGRLLHLGRQGLQWMSSGRLVCPRRSVTNGHDLELAPSNERFWFRSTRWEVQSRKRCRWRQCHATAASWFVRTWSARRRPGERGLYKSEDYSDSWMALLKSQN